ncbi:MAG: 3'-5' exonuclease [Pseudomonadota bacterium]
MSLWQWSREHKPLSQASRNVLETWRAAPIPELRRPLRDVSWTVVDTESSGPDAKHDRLLSIGACTVSGGHVVIGSGFEALLRQEQPSAADNILVHRIGGTAQLDGENPEWALAAFLDYARRNPLVAFHARFDATLLARALRDRLGLRFRALWVDAAHVATALFPQSRGENWGLDQWLAYFGIENYARHDALADAFCTAQLFLVLLERAASQGIGDARALIGIGRAQHELTRWLSR